MSFEIKNRWTGAVQYIRELSAEVVSKSYSAQLGLAVKKAVEAGANLRDCPVKIEGIHRAVYEAASNEGALDMNTWHCDTTHCRAGWVVTLAGDGGRALEYALGTAAAATLIYMASDPKLEEVPDFYCGNSAALADMKRLADAEVAA